MESTPLEEPEDDFAKVFRLTYPPFVFGDHQHDDDHTKGVALLTRGDGDLLRPLIMAIYALGMNAQTNNFSHINLEPIQVNVAQREYTLTAYIDENLAINYNAWSALISLSPGRLRRISVSPKVLAPHRRMVMELVIVFKSECAPLVATFASYLRLDTNSLLARASPQPPETSQLEADIQQSHDQVIEASRQRTLDTLEGLKRTCGKFVASIPGLHNSDYDVEKNFSVSMSNVQLHRGLVTWFLPAHVPFDILQLLGIRSEFASLIIDASVSVRTQASTNPLIANPLTHIVVTWVFAPYGFAPIALIDSTTWLFFTEASEDDETLAIPLVDQSNTRTVRKHTRQQLATRTAVSSNSSKKRKRPNAFVTHDLLPEPDAAPVSGPLVPYDADDEDKATVPEDPMIEQSPRNSKGLLSTFFNWFS